VSKKKVTGMKNKAKKATRKHRLKSMLKSLKKKFIPKKKASAVKVKTALKKKFRSNKQATEKDVSGEMKRSKVRRLLDEAAFEPPHVSQALDRKRRPLC